MVARARYTLPHIVMCTNSLQAIAIILYSGHVDMAVRKPRDYACLNCSTYFVGQRKDQLIMYSLDLCVSCFTYLAIFMAHQGSREALKFY